MTDESAKTENTKTESDPGTHCPICHALGFEETLHRVEGLVEVAKNPQVEKGAPRVVDCSGGCRFSLEPHFNPKSNGTFSYMTISSERNPDAVVNHYWFHPDWIKDPVK